MDAIRASVERVRELVARAAERAGRRAEDVLLIGVSKTVDVDRIGQAVTAGLNALGENRVQEAKTKIETLGHPVPWHLIGHLQTNKSRDAVALFDVIHSIDRLDLAREVERRARASGRVVDVLVEVNLGGEGSKSGVSADGLGGLLDALNGLTQVRVRGLMAIPPAVERAEEARQWFRALRGLAERHGVKDL